MTSKQKRERLKFVLSMLTDGNRNIFMRMYSPSDLECDINKVVDNMPPEKLKWGLRQAENSYYKIFKMLKDN